MEAFDQAMNSAEQAILNDLETGFAANSADVLQTVINQDVAVTLEQIAQMSAEITGAMDPEMVSLPLKFSAGLPGKAQFVLGKTLTAKIVDFMIMGDGEVEFMPEEHLDGVVEALNQIMGGFLTELTGRLGTPVETSGDRAEIIPSEGLAAAADNVVVTFKVSIEDQPEFRLYKLYTRDVIEELVRQLSPAESDSPPTNDSPTPVQEAKFTQFAGEASGDSSGLVKHSDDRLGLVMDLSLPITIELGRTRMLIRDVVKLSAGSIIELNKLSGEPVDIFINEKKFARGEVVVIDENFGVRITEIIPAPDRLNHLVEM